MQIINGLLLIPPMYKLTYIIFYYEKDNKLVEDWIY
jgi:hypothetical protein